MKRNKKKLSTGVIALLLVGLVLVFTYVASWLITCGVIWLMTLCFGWTFKWSIATGIWLIVCLLKTIFTHKTTVSNK